MIAETKVCESAFPIEQFKTTPHPMLQSAESMKSMLQLRVNPNSNPQTVEGGAPPTYDSLYGRIKEAKQEHGTGFQFFKAVAIILSAVIGGNL